MTRGPSPKSRRSPVLTIVILVLVAGGATWGLSALSGDDADGTQTVRGARVERGSLRISVVERGNLEAADSVTLESELEGTTTVLWLIEEGTHVEPGDLLCELDTSSLVDRRVQQEIDVQNSEATLIKAQQNHAIQISQNESDIATAERDLDFARLDLEKYLDGDMPQELQSKEEDILLADEELTRARQDLKWSEALHDRGFLEQAQLDADRLAETRATVKLRQAERAKELFVDYEIPRRKKELEANVEEMVRELERVTLQAKARIADFEADVRTAQAKFDLEKSDLAKLNSQIDKATITSPVAGMVVYAVDSRSRWDDGEPMQEGSQVRERQDIITIPRSDGFVAEASLHESVLEKVDTGMPCLVSVDALRGDTYAGVVSFKALLPDQQSRWMNPDLRVYRTTIKLVETDDRMRPGMSCSIEILVDELEDVTYVPVQAVFLDGGGTICLVSDGAGPPEKRPVEIGQNNGKWVEIVSGVEEGETVLLAVPVGVSLEPAREGSTRGPRGDDQGEADRAGDGDADGAPAAGADVSADGRRPPTGGWSGGRDDDEHEEGGARPGGQPPAGRVGGSGGAPPAGDRGGDA